ncbi:alcohol dehydrogenase class IV [Breznakibacter xylanolyticus]|uniref:Alcohol dehydrogenase class IV n=1 Tax=Breznakibacter xylanolyticus TaxID=990 RepID=A0A2W7NKQ7_9BACT|nr:alcohol dehydrogenase-like regulatory protein ErcA [Breznakibacter xylanolyticus]PZX20053.1 alcohol dehydrogenase class IV [Breznakibacter xylanolyticus]
MTESPELSLRKFVAPEFIFGKDALQLTGRYARNLGAQRVLLATDAGVMAAGWANRVVESLENEGIPVTIFKDISPNPRSQEVMNGAEWFRQQQCNVIIAVGGGSVMDCAKGIGIVVSNGGHILNYKGVDQITVPMPPLICIPTTGGTAADVSQFAIINNEIERVKIAIISKAVVPDLALIDPATLTTMDAYLTACTGIDALVHAIEAYVSNAASPVTDLNAAEAIRLIHGYLNLSIAEPDNLAYRGQVMMASLYAGLAFSNASLGCVHAMAHSLGGYLDLPHGECNAMLLPHVIGFNQSAAPQRIAQVAAWMGLDTTHLPTAKQRTAIVQHIIAFKQNAGISHTLGTYGVSLSDLPLLAAKAINDPCNITNPRQPTQQDLETIYREAM